MTRGNVSQTDESWKAQQSLGYGGNDLHLLEKEDALFNSSQL